MRTFRQVDVFGSTPLGGNPVAVVHGADGLSDGQMRDFARWTNLSETTFLLPPTTEGADYRLRIFTPSSELPFAGHPTIGSAHAWLEAGGAPRTTGHVIQECGAGLVHLRRSAEPPGGRLAFAAPPLLRSGEVNAEDRAAILAPLRLTDDEVVDMAWIDNGPGWVGVREGGDTACEVRALCPMGSGITEDPVTGSLNAGIGQWLSGTVLPTSYVATQGTVIGRSGRVHVEREGDTIWVGGDAQTVVRGEVSIA